ncbi:MAG: PIG-L family deacetylase [Actinomycetota bacterium]|nr:PIG-L family deacetylase [Actinomycetota bacterium]
MTTSNYDEFEGQASALGTPNRALTIGAHPDDAEFGAGATLARWADDGCEITMLIVTDGSKGSWNPDEDRADLIARRKKEQTEAANTLGASTTVHLGEVDGELEYSSRLRRDIALQIRLHRPDVVLTHDPWQRYQLHPDHRATGLAAVDGVISAREPLALTDTGTDAHRPEAVLLWSADEPDYIEPVNQQWFDVKLAALLCHSSQAVTSMGDAADSDAKRHEFAQRLHHWHEKSGSVLGAGPAETFKRLTP